MTGLAGRDRQFCVYGGVGDGSDLGELLDGAIGQSGQHMGQVFSNGYTEFAAALDDQEDDGDLWPGLFAAHVQPFASSSGNLSPEPDDEPFCTCVGEGKPVYGSRYGWFAGGGRKGAKCWLWPLST